ncbi:branched-chain amino acid ABC transporter permease [Dactylosporangium sp. NPDC051485]|uniref:branched-chain amino acid ABC transporter permease n=1 Tax=Dactylosporangium sp. NPDC051485 TaxID=3154846 RepID=UPI0034481235
MGEWLVNGLDGLSYGMLLFVVAAGLTLVYGVMSVLNLAHGSLYLAGAYLACLLSTGSLLTLGLALAAGIALGAGGGAALQLALRPVHRYGHLAEVLVTLGVALLLADLYSTWTGGAPMPTITPTVLAGTIPVGDRVYPVYRLTFIAVAAVLAAGLHLLLRRTTAGIQLRATVADPDMAAATGIPTRRVSLAAFAAGGALAVGGGVLGAPILGPAPGVDTTVLVLCLTVVVIGGTGSIPATLGAALLVGMVHSIGVAAAPLAAPFALVAVMLAVLVLRRRTAVSTA